MLFMEAMMAEMKRVMKL
ncbi:hypothetical protein TIFTF001_055882 [Ficus carica]|uniref:Uncharacterized protein n=1 Tax=Ficus carica TaxID=3494 RepID=A0AA88E9X2_FICCA|nr:hypothetical protein TIFTF001_055882 [Ficus carica]